MKNLFSVAGKVALVTGGSRGIGLMIESGFVENGATVYISSRKKEVCDEVAPHLLHPGTQVEMSILTDTVQREVLRRPAAKLYGMFEEDVW